MGLFASLLKLYAAQPAKGLRGPKQLHEEANKAGIAATLADCQQALSSLPAYTLYKPSTSKFPRNRIRAEMPGEVVQVSLVYEA